MSPFEGANLAGMCDRLAMESKRKTRVKGDTVVLTYPLMEGGGIPEAGKNVRGLILADPEVGFKHAHILRHKQKYQLGSWDYGSREQRKCLRLFRQRYNRRREGLGFNGTPAASVIYM